MKDFSAIKEAMVSYNTFSICKADAEYLVFQEQNHSKWLESTSLRSIEYSHQLPWKIWLREEAKALNRQDKFRCFEIFHLLGEGCFTDINRLPLMSTHCSYTAREP